MTTSTSSWTVRPKAASASRRPISGASTLNGADRVKVWKLLEMQRHAMLMYTSCGWFFDELSGIETVQVIQYAGRVVQLAEELFGDEASSERLRSEKLALAKSNIPEHGDGAAIYEKFVKPASVDLLKLGAHYAMSSLFESYPDNTRIYAYSVDNKDYRLKRSGKMRLAFGKARFTSEITQDSDMLMFGVLHFGDHNLHGGVALYRSEEAYRELSKAARDALSRSDLPATIHALDEGFPGHTYSLKNLFRDEQRKVLTEVLESTVDHSFSVAREMYEEQAQLLRFMSDCGIPIPKELKAAAEVALNGLLRQALGAPELDQTAIQNLLEEMRVAAIPLDEGGLEIVLRRNLERGADQFFEDPRNLARLDKVPRQSGGGAVPCRLLWCCGRYRTAVTKCCKNCAKKKCRKPMRNGWRSSRNWLGCFRCGLRIRVRNGGLTDCCRDGRAGRQGRA